MNILEVENLSVRYGAVEAVRGLSLRVAEGEAITLIGAQRSGKEQHPQGHPGAGAGQRHGALSGRSPSPQREPEVRGRHGAGHGAGKARGFLPPWR